MSAKLSSKFKPGSIHWIFQFFYLVKRIHIIGNYNRNIYKEQNRNDKRVQCIVKKFTDLTHKLYYFKFVRR